MKIVIDIPKEIYELCVKDDYFVYKETDIIRQAIKNGTPLDKIRAEIEQIKEAEYQIYGKGSWRFVDKCLNIIDKYKAESGDR